MRKQPFHRKILPWIFAITFVAMAPALVFYTAGYRWNPKKDKIERNGTVIIDSTPSSADISIDGRMIAEKTPVTIQNMAPGVHRFRISKNGYFAWEKTLDVIPERVTFANDIKLYKRSEPSMHQNAEPGIMSISTDERTILLIPNASTSHMTLIDTRSPGSGLSAGPPPPGVAAVFWSPNGRYALIEGDAATSTSWVLDTGGTRQLTQLPSGRYRWEGSQLVGNDGTMLTEIRLPDLSFSRAPLPKRGVDKLDAHVLVTPTGTADIVYIDTHTPLQGFVLPRKDWMFWLAEKNDVILRSGNSWISLATRGAGIEYHAAQGKMPVPDPSSKIAQYLFLNGTELWAWNPLAEPELLLRQSDIIKNAIWDRDGKSVIYATDKKIIALNLDARDGRLETTLAEFDRAYDLVLVGKILYVLAEKNSTTGLWQMAIE